MKIKYAYVNPGGNETVLVLSKVKRKEQVKIAQLFLKNWSFRCEQVGFLEKPKNSTAAIRLQMMGGEFCANGLRATAAYLASLKQNKDADNFLLESSGTDRLISSRIGRNKSGKIIESEVSIPISPDQKILENLTLFLNTKMIAIQKINLEGITHFLISGKWFDKKKNYKKLFQQLYKNYQINTEAVGLIFYKKLKPNRFTAIPIVYVRPTQSIVLETSCASGSVALALAQGISRPLSIMQPSGFPLQVLINKISGVITNIKIAGTIQEVGISRMEL